MKYFIYQGNDKDCGYASLKMLLANLSKDKSYLFLPKTGKRENFTLSDICKIGAKYGVKLKSYSCDETYYDQLRPLSLAVVRENHVVMIKKVNSKRITLYDPDLGIQKLKRDEFIAIWKNIVIEVTSADNILKIEKRKQSVLPLKLRLFEASAALISAGVLIATFYLLNNEQNAVFSLIFLCLFLTSQIIENIIMYKEINFFDYTYINRYFSRSENKSKEKYYEFINFKQKFFGNSRSMLSATLIAFMVTFLLCLNDFRNIFVLIVLVLIKVLELFLFSNSYEKKKNYIEKCENTCFESKELCVDYALKANMFANEIASQEKLKQIFYIVVSFAFSIGMMFITKSSGCNYVIFHFGLYYLGFNSFSQIITGLSNRKDVYKMECCFFDSCN